MLTELQRQGIDAAIDMLEHLRMLLSANEGKAEPYILVSDTEPYVHPHYGPGVFATEDCVKSATPTPEVASSLGCGDPEWQAKHNTLSTAQDERGAFEAWAIAEGFDVKRGIHRDNYAGAITESVWAAWQARAAASPVSGAARDASHVPDIASELGMNQHLESNEAREMLSRLKPALSVLHTMLNTVGLSEGAKVATEMLDEIAEIERIDRAGGES